MNCKFCNNLMSKRIDGDICYECGYFPYTKYSEIFYFNLVEDKMLPISNTVEVDLETKKAYVIGNNSETIHICFLNDVSFTPQTARELYDKHMKLRCLK